MILFERDRRKSVVGTNIAYAGGISGSSTFAFPSFLPFRVWPTFPFQFRVTANARARRHGLIFYIRDKKIEYWIMERAKRCDRERERERIETSTDVFMHYAFPQIRFTRALFVVSYGFVSTCRTKGTRVDNYRWARFAYAYVASISVNRSISFPPHLHSFQKSRVRIFSNRRNFCRVSFNLLVNFAIDASIIRIQV